MDLEKQDQDRKRDARSPWEPMTLTYVGMIDELIQGGAGKSGQAQDQGDIFKPPGQG
jgi:hypothetical protein